MNRDTESRMILLPQCLQCRRLFLVFDPPKRFVDLFCRKAVGIHVVQYFERLGLGEVFPRNSFEGDFNHLLGQRSPSGYLRCCRILLFNGKTKAQTYK